MQVVEYLKAAMKSLWPGKSTDAVVADIVGSRKLKVSGCTGTVTDRSDDTLFEMFHPTSIVL